MLPKQSDLFIPSIITAGFYNLFLYNIVFAGG